MPWLCYFHSSVLVLQVYDLRKRWSANSKVCFFFCLCHFLTDSHQCSGLLIQILNERCRKKLIMINVGLFSISKINNSYNKTKPSNSWYADITMGNSSSRMYSRANNPVNLTSELTTEAPQCTFRKIESHHPNFSLISFKDAPQKVVYTVGRLLLFLLPNVTQRRSERIFPFPLSFQS